MNGLLTTSEAAKLIKVKRATVARWLNNGILVGFRINGRWRIKNKEIQRLLEKESLTKIGSRDA